MLTDTELLRRYAHDKVEAAFGELVSRHAPLVYSTALRIVRGDEPLAYDVAQSVFFDFARKAASLCQRAEAETEGGAAVNSSLSGWLYTSTRFAAAKLVRAEQTRRKHEQKAHAMNDLLNAGSAEPDWADLRPVLDDAMGNLEDVDREALLIRFFEGKDLRTVGTILGLSEDAARMRISSSLEKLRQVLAKRGVTTTATALSVTLTAHGVTEVPAGMVAALTTTSLAAGGATVGSTSTLTTIKLMASLKTKLLIGSLVAVGVAVPLVVQQKSANQLRAENEALRGQVTALQSQPPSVQTNVTVLPEPSSEGPEHSELLRLRGLVARLNAEARNNNRPRTVPQTTKATGADTVDRIGPYELFTVICSVHAMSTM